MKNKNLIGQIVRHEGKIYQILSVNTNIVFAHSYGEDNFVKETILVSKATGKVIASKSYFVKENKTARATRTYARVI